MGKFSELTLDAVRHRDQHGIPERSCVAYLAHVRSARQRGIPFEFTLLGWHLWWKHHLAAIPGAKRGRHRGEYVMARYGDTGPYTLENVYLSTTSDNCRLAHLDKPEKPGSRTGQHLRIRGDGHPRSRPVLTPHGRFGSVALAAEAHGLTRQGAACRARKGRLGWRYC